MLRTAKAGAQSRLGSPNPSRHIRRGHGQTRWLVEFYESVKCERLVEAAAKTDARTHVAVLLGGYAGLRPGEILGLE